MAYGIIHTFKGGTREQFEAVNAKVDPPDGSLTPGEIFEASGPSDDGWVVMALFESKAAWEHFRDDILIPGFTEVGAAGFATPPTEISFDATNVQHRDVATSRA
jgi:hypothetical protein